DVQLAQRVRGQRVDVLPQAHAQLVRGEERVREVEEQAAAGGLDDLGDDTGVDARAQQAVLLAAVGDVLYDHVLGACRLRQSLDVRDQHRRHAPARLRAGVADRDVREGLARGYQVGVEVRGARGAHQLGDAGEVHAEARGAELGGEVDVARAGGRRGRDQVVPVRDLVRVDAHGAAHDEPAQGG